MTSCSMTRSNFEFNGLPVPFFSNLQWIFFSNFDTCKRNLVRFSLLKQPIFNQQPQLYALYERNATGRDHSILSYVCISQRMDESGIPLEVFLKLLS